MMMKSIACGYRRLGVGGLALLGAFQAAEVNAAEKLSVYTAFETEQLAPYKQAFEKANPGIEIEWVRDSTGIITARLLAEKANPQADVVWGLAASSLLLLDRDGMLEPYAPKGLAAIKPKFKSDKTPPTWSASMPGWGRSATTPSRAKRRSYRSPRPGPT